MSRVMKYGGAEWIGEIPEEWFSKRLKYGVKIRNCRASNLNSDLGYIGLENVESFSGKLIQTDSNYDTEQALLAKRYDILFGKLRPYLAKVYYAKNDTACSGEFVVFYGFEHSQSFLRYQLLSHWFINIVDSSTYGAKMPRANINFIRNLSFLFPSESEQNEIAEFLNIQCAKIDRLIALQEDMIAELRAYKQSVITEAVAKGLDLDVPMKDSGLEWIGDIPFHWVISKQKAIITSIKSGVSVNAGSNPATDTEIGVLKTSCVYGDVFRPEENKNVNEDEIGLVSCPVEQNTIIVSRMNTSDLVGSCGYVGKDYKNLFLPDRLWKVSYVTDVNVKYVWYSLTNKNIKSVLASIATGTSSSMKNIAQSQFENLLLLLPNHAEQCSIVTYLDKKLTKTSEMIKIKQSKIDTLKEYKKSLIYECVTGKRDCTMGRQEDGA